MTEKEQQTVTDLSRELIILLLETGAVNEMDNFTIVGRNPASKIDIITDCNAEDTSVINVKITAHLHKLKDYIDG